MLKCDDAGPNTLCGRYPAGLSVFKKWSVVSTYALGLIVSLATQKHTFYRQSSPPKFANR